MKNCFICFLLLSIIAFSCDSARTEKEGTKVTFKIANAIEDAGIVIECVKPGDRRLIKKITMGSGNKIRTTIKNTQPLLYQATIFERQTVDFIISPEDQNVIIEVSGNNEFNQKVNISGSKESKRYLQLNKIVSNRDKKVKAFNLRYAERFKRKETTEELEQELMVIESNFQQELTALLSKMDNSIVPILAFESGYINTDTEFAFLKDLSAKSTSQLPKSSYVKHFVKSVKSLQRLAVGSPAPEISLNNQSGETINLSSLKGKYVLIDFWASWCKPCRKESPRLVSLYQKHNSKGFEIFSVSLDRERKDWVKAILKDGIGEWTHVSDLKYFNSEAVSTYEIESIPATYLINPDGVIIGKNLRGKLLEDKLYELFGG